MNVNQQKILFVTGKGGVGKSAVALAFANKLSQKASVLLVELGLRSFYADFLKLSIQYEPTPYRPNLDIALWSGPDCLREYAMHLLKIESLYKLFFENRISKTLIDVAPALSELAILGKITSGIRKVGPPLPYDYIVVDCYATGHMMALLRAPRGMAEAIRFGPMAEQSATMLQAIRDPLISQYFIVTLPEELPAVEADELYRDIHEEVRIKPVLFCNKVWPAKEIQELQRANEKNQGTTHDTNPRASQSTEAEMVFLQELNDLIQRQTAWINYLKHRHPDLYILPMTYSSDPELIVANLERHLP